MTKSQKLFNIFESALIAKEAKQYKKALTLFEEVNRDFPSRENYNNCGVIKTLQALDLKPRTSEESNYPKRFLYPLEIDNSTRLQKEITRSITSNDEDKMFNLLKSAQKDFEKAIKNDFDTKILNYCTSADVTKDKNRVVGYTSAIVGK